MSNIEEDDFDLPPVSGYRQQSIGLERKDMKPKASKRDLDPAQELLNGPANSEDNNNNNNKSSRSKDSMPPYYTSEPGLQSDGTARGLRRSLILDSNNEIPIAIGQAIGFGSVLEGKKHYKRDAAKRRFLAAARKVRNVNLVTSSGRLLSERSPLKPSERTAHSDDGDKENNNNNNNKDDGGEEREQDEIHQEIKPSQYQVLWDMVFGHFVSFFLVFAPFAVVANLTQWGPLWIFWLNFFTMVPLASILGDFTQEVATHTNQVIGGLVNATFGNTVEVIVGIQALIAGQYRVVQASMLGSIFSNLLLVLGSCFFFGGITRKEQTFNLSAATANMSLLALSSIALVLPTPFAHYYIIADVHVLEISRIAAVFLMFMYLQLLYFQLRTHSYLFEDEDDEEGEIPLSTALIGLLVVTLLIAFFSQYLVNSINGFVASSGLSHTFVGLIILPIVGNAVEHVTAITVAMKDKMDLAMGVAIGSCTQISLFVVPLVVIVGWIFNKDMTLNFPHFEIILYVLAILTVSICLSNPRGNWLEGSLMITCYIMIAIGFYYENVHSYTSAVVPTMAPVTAGP